MNVVGGSAREGAAPGFEGTGYLVPVMCSLPIQGHAISPEEML